MLRLGRAEGEGDERRMYEVEIMGSQKQKVKGIEGERERKGR